MRTQDSLSERAMRLAGQIFNASGGYIVGPRERPERCDTMAQRRKIVVALVHHVVGGRGKGQRSRHLPAALPAGRPASWGSGRGLNMTDGG